MEEREDIVKIVVLNFPQMCVDVIPVSPEEYEEYGGDENFDDVGFLGNKYPSISELQWMVCTDDPCEIPVFWNDEQIPYFTL